MHVLITHLLFIHGSTDSLTCYGCGPHLCITGRPDPPWIDLLLKFRIYDYSLMDHAWTHSLAVDLSIYGSIVSD